MTVMDAKDRRIEQLECLLSDIAYMADGHRHATACNEDGNIALVNIRNMAAIALGLHDRLKENGTLFPVAAQPEAIVPSSPPVRR